MFSVQGRGKQIAENTRIDVEKQLKRAERMQKRAKVKADQAQKKAEKMAATEAYRSKKPGECLKVSAYFTSLRSWLTVQ